MTNGRLSRLAVVGFVPIAWLFPIIEIIADPVAREDLWRDHPRTDVSAAVAQDETVKAAFLRRPVFARRNHDGPPGSSSGSAKNERVDSGAIEDRGVRQLARTFFDHDTGDGASGQEHGEKRNGEKFGAHENWVSEKEKAARRVVLFLNPACQQFRYLKVS
jgi:hypothetical protein